MVHYVMAKVMCLRCAVPMVKQSGRFYYCPGCKRFYRLKSMVPVWEAATYEEVQTALAQEVYSKGLEQILEGGNE